MLELFFPFSYVCLFLKRKIHMFDMKKAVSYEKNLCSVEIFTEQVQIQTYLQEWWTYQKGHINTIRFFYILMTTGYFNTKVVRNLHEFSHLWEAQNIRKNNTHKSNHIK